MDIETVLAMMGGLSAFFAVLWWVSRPCRHNRCDSFYNPATMDWSLYCPDCDKDIT